MQFTADRHFFGRNASILLDVLRFAAALVVVLSHMPLFLNGPEFIPERSGNTAVCIFFVLSGFVIRYVTVTRVPTGRDYAIDRITRIYSVVVPALVLTMLLEYTAFHHSPTAFRFGADPTPWEYVPKQLLQNLTFTVGWWGYGFPPLANGAFWSLSFECVYYALYGFWRYAPRGRWVLIPLLLLLVGPAITLLFPIWLLGAALYDLYAYLHRQKTGIAWATLAMLLYGAMLFVLRDHIVHWLLMTDVHQRSIALTRLMASFAWGRDQFHGAPLHWLDRLSLSFFISGVLMAVAMLPFLLALDRFVPAASKRAERRVRFVADSTFTLYLVHLPVLLWLMTMHGQRWTNWRQGSAMLGLMIVISIVLAGAFDHLKNAMRGGLHRLLPAGTDPRRPATPADAG
ncbi:MAG: acyltransferase family protein [Janthinobacterium lividum]